MNEIPLSRWRRNFLSFHPQSPGLFTQALGAGPGVAQQNTIPAALDQAPHECEDHPLGAPERGGIGKVKYLIVWRCHRDLARSRLHLLNSGSAPSQKK
jgi:hypothetical protein